MIKVMIVEDSMVVRELLRTILSSDPDINVVGIAKNGLEAVEQVSIKKPDIITMDINMPGLNGLEATRKIMETYPVPIVMISSYWKPEEVNITFQAMEAGALAVLEKPSLGRADYDKTVKKIIETVKLMSEIKVVRRWPKDRMTEKIIVPGEAKPLKENYKVLVIGASTGGPVVLKTILSGLKGNFSLPVLIVQHIAHGFLQGLLDWLGQFTLLPLHVATEGEMPLPGHIYFPPDDYHMGINGNGRISLSKEKMEHSVRPSVSYLFRSVAKKYGPNSIAVLLTGMGKDGSAELKLLKDRGGITIAQNRETSVVFGMPGEAVKAGGALFVMTPEQIVEKLSAIVT